MTDILVMGMDAVRRAGAVTAILLVTLPATAQPEPPPPASSAPVADLLASSPRVPIANGRISARVALPDPVRGFYRGTRFDQAGVVTSLKTGGKEFYGPWFNRTAPEVLDYTYTADGVVAGLDSGVSGPVEEFAPLGFTPTPGSLFVKIGVGVLRQPDDKPYDHYRHYEIVDHGKWEIHNTANSITFIQTLSGAGYALRYQKSLALVPGKAQMVIEHRLTNSGGTPIDTTVYDHNFLRLTPGDDGIRITFPFAVSSAMPPPPDLVRFDGNTLTYLRAMNYKERVSSVLTGYGAAASDYHIAITDLNSHAGVTITGDQPITRLNLFSIDMTQAVEPTIAVQIAPGAEKRWRYTYAYTPPH